MIATAAKGSLPYKHRTLAEVRRDERDRVQLAADLDQISRERALTLTESRALERLLRRDA